MVLDLTHHARASRSDLLAWARFWQWEWTVERELPRIIADDEIKILFQPIYRLSDGVPVVRGFEALSRFPVAPQIPVGLWFRTAHDLGLLRDLELAAIRAAISSLGRVSEQAFLCANASLDSVPDLVEIIPSSLDDRLMIDLPYSSLRDPRGGEMFHALRQCGARVAVDDVPLEDLHILRPTLLELRPDCVKVDVLTGLVGSPMARFNLAEGSAWCQGAGIDLIAERVERMADLPVLDAVGVEWAQGYCLSDPVEL
jgi:EAL domain-containing protein (putative c-di-GMP-specific phosphodiesterase class I)